MKTFVKKSNNLSTETELKFGQSVQPTLISNSEFNKLFKYHRSIGEGSFGTVKCVENCYGEFFAIKQSKDNEQTYGVYREAAIMKKFNHPNILKFIGFYQIQQSQKLVILTEFCKFKSLKDFEPFLSSLPEQEKYRLVVEIFSGLYAMHSQNLMHRDLKPENILIDEKKQAKLCDFGFCRYDSQDDISKSRKIGTPLYNSPETEKGVYTKKCDIFSYGLIVYFVFSNGKHLFKRSTTHQQLKSQRKQYFRNGNNAFNQLNIPKDIIEILEKTITEKEEKRINTQDLKVFWQRTLQQKNMKTLIKSMQESEMINNYEPFHSTDPKQSLVDCKLTNQQQFASFIVKQNTLTNDELQAADKILIMFETFGLISGLMKEFKLKIQEVELSKIQKQLISYGFLYQLELKLEGLLSGCNLLIQTEKVMDNQATNQCMESLLTQIIKKKQQLSSVIVKIGKYLQLIRNLIKPSQLLQPLSKSFDELRKLQAFIKDTSSQNTIKNLKIIQEIENNQQFYQFIENKYKPQINVSSLNKDFGQLLIKYRANLAVDNKKEERQKIDILFERISKI